MIQKNREFDQQNLELQESVRRLHVSEESNSDTETKDSLSAVEIQKFRSELYTIQQQLRLKDEELVKTKELLKECEIALKLAESSKNLMITELHNTRTKLISAELDHENSRNHYAEIDRSRYERLLTAYVLRVQFSGRTN